MIEITKEEFDQLIGKTYENEECGMIETVQEINEGQFYFRGVLIAKIENNKFFKY